jgi:hypothetical protein
MIQGPCLLSDEGVAGLFAMLLELAGADRAARSGNPDVQRVARTS